MRRDTPLLFAQSDEYCCPTCEKCHRPAYVIGMGSAKLIAAGSAKVIGMGSAKLIAIDELGRGFWEPWRSAKAIISGSAKLIAAGSAKVIAAEAHPPPRPGGQEEVDVSAKKLETHILQDLVRLHRMGTGSREVARLLGISPNTEREYRIAFGTSGDTVRRRRQATVADGAPSCGDGVFATEAGSATDFQRGGVVRAHRAAVSLGTDA